MIKIVCLNTKEVFESAEVAGQYAGVDRATINRNSKEETYRMGAGAHPETEEKLYWLREYLYDPTKDYSDLPKVKRKTAFKAKKKAKQEAVICINTGKRFETILEAAIFANVRPRTIVDRSLENTFTVGSGFNESVEGKLYWLREKLYDPQRNYMSEILGIKGSKVRKPRRRCGKKVVCLNTRESFEDVEDAAKWCGISAKTILQNSTMTTYRLGAGNHPETSEKLHWLRIEYYNPLEEYRFEKGKCYLESELFKEIICLNTLETFSNLKEAAKWAKISAGSLVTVSGKTTYKTGRGYHPETGERLYWLKKSLYNPKTVYQLEKVMIADREAVARDEVKIVCLNNKKVFNSVTEAAEWAKISRKELIIKSRMKNKRQSTGFNEEVGERLFWLRESDYNSEIDYIKEYNLDVSKFWRNKSRMKPENIYCLNNHKCFSSFEEAAEWARIDNVRLLKRYATIKECYKSIGRHPETGEKLHWLRESFYVENADYAKVFEY